MNLVPILLLIFHGFVDETYPAEPFSVARSGKGVKFKSQAMHKGNLKNGCTCGPAIWALNGFMS